MVNSVLVVAITGKHTIDIDGHPTRNEWFVLVLLIIVAPVAAAVGWRVSRITSVRTRTVVATVSVLVVIASGFFGGPSERVFANLVFEGIVIAAALVLTACGVGSILGWALRTAADNLAFGRRAVRPRASCRAADRPGVLQHLCVVDGVDRQPTPAVAGAAVPRADRRRVHHLGHDRPGATDAGGLAQPPPRTTDGSRAPRSSRCRILRRHSRCPGPSASTWFSSSPPRRYFRSGWWPSSPASSSSCSA